MERLDIQDYIRPLLRWWWLLLIATVLAALASYFYTVRQPEVYTSQSTLMVGTVLLQSDPDPNAIYLPQLLAETYAEIGLSETVRQATMESLEMSWLPFYWVQALPNSPMIEVSVSAEIPELAQSVAVELVNQLILQGPEGQEFQGNQQFIRDRLVKLEADIETTESEIERNRAKLADLFSAREIATAQDEIAALEIKLGSLNDDYIDLLSQGQIESPNTINTIGKASLPTIPDPSNLWFNVFLAAAVGFVLASGGAYVLEYLDDTVKTSDDVKRQFGLPTLSAIPVIAQSKSTVLSGNVAIDDSKLIMLSNPQSPYAEAFRILRTNLQFSNVDRPNKHILITSPEPGDGKSTTIANLGIALAQGGRRVIIVDADLHRPTQHQVFQVPNNMGVSTALFNGLANITQMLHPTRTPGLRVLTSGPLPPNPSELLSSDLMEQLLLALDNEADIILLDTPPATILVDAAALSVQADAVVLVVRAGKTSRHTAKQAVDGLRQVRANIAGVILNGVSIQNSGYHYNYNQYGYNRYSHSAPVGRPPYAGGQPPPQAPHQGPIRHAPQSPAGGQARYINGQPHPGQPHPGQPHPHPGQPHSGAQRPSSNAKNDGPSVLPQMSTPNGSRPPSPYATRSGQSLPGQSQPGQPQSAPHTNGAVPHMRGHSNGHVGPANPDHPNGSTNAGFPYGYAASPQMPPNGMPPSNDVDPRTGVSVNNYGHVQMPEQKPPTKKGLGRFWRS